MLCKLFDLFGQIIPYIIQLFPSSSCVEVIFSKTVIFSGAGPLLSSTAMHWRLRSAMSLEVIFNYSINPNMVNPKV